MRKIEEQIEKIEYVASAHHLHVWSLDGGQAVLTAHVITDKELTSEEYTELKKNSSP